MTRYFLMRVAEKRLFERARERSLWPVSYGCLARLNEAFGTGEEVVLLFTVSMSGAFQGCARMASPAAPDGGRGSGHTDACRIEWLHQRELPYADAEHLVNPLSDPPGPVRAGKDGTEIEAAVAEELVALMGKAPAAAPKPAAPPPSESRSPQRSGGDGGKAGAAGPGAGAGMGMPGVVGAGLMGMPDPFLMGMQGMQGMNPMLAMSMMHPAMMGMLNPLMMMGRLPGMMAAGMRPGMVPGMGVGAGGGGGSADAVKPEPGGGARDDRSPPRDGPGRDHYADNRWAERERGNAPERGRYDGPPSRGGPAFGPPPGFGREGPPPFGFRDVPPPRGGYGDRGDGPPPGFDRAWAGRGGYDREGPPPGWGRDPWDPRGPPPRDYGPPPRGYERERERGGYGGRPPRERSAPWEGGRERERTPAEERPDLLRMTHEEYVERFRQLKSVQAGGTGGAASNDDKQLVAAGGGGEGKENAAAAADASGAEGPAGADISGMSEDDYVAYCERFCRQTAMPFQEAMVRQHYRSVRAAMAQMAGGGSGGVPAAS